MTTNRRWIARQGDVLMLEVSAIPAEAMTRQRPRDRDRVVLAYGEVTGHAHVVTAPHVNAYGPSDDAFWLDVSEGGVTVVHDEHAAIVIPDRVRYVEVRRQREYSEAGEMRVAD